LKNPHSPTHKNRQAALLLTHPTRPTGNMRAANPAKAMAANHILNLNRLTGLKTGQAGAVEAIDKKGNPPNKAPHMGAATRAGKAMALPGQDPRQSNCVT